MYVYMHAFIPQRTFGYVASKSEILAACCNFNYIQQTITTSTKEKNNEQVACKACKSKKKKQKKPTQQQLCMYVERVANVNFALQGLPIYGRLRDAHTMVILLQCF